MLTLGTALLVVTYYDFITTYRDLFAFKKLKLCKYVLQYKFYSKKLFNLVVLFKIFKVAKLAATCS